MVASSKTQIIDTGGVVLHQLLCGREIADPAAAKEHGQKKVWEFAKGMKNFVYLVVDARSKKALVIDGCWDVDGIFQYADHLGVEIMGVLYTHSHFDHAGGNVPPQMTGGIPVQLPGAQSFAALGLPIWAGASDADAIIQQCQISKDAVTSAADGAEVKVGNALCTAFATPGHTPGSICLHVPCAADSGKAQISAGTLVPAGEGALVTGDTLFVDNCGRVDLPGSNPRDMYKSLSRLCQGLPAGCRVLPGHDYSPVPHCTVGTARETNQMVLMGLRSFASPGRLPPYQECTCSLQMSSAFIRSMIGDAQPSVTITSLSGGRVQIFGAPDGATIGDLSKVLYVLLRAVPQISARNRKLCNAQELTFGEEEGKPLTESQEIQTLGSPPSVSLLSADLAREEGHVLWFNIGAEVMVQGLKGNPELNGKRGKIQNFDGMKGRYGVQIGGVDGLKGLKPANLSPASKDPPVPSFDVEEVD